jgi:two-component system CheB/CheR fusion protein
MVVEGPRATLADPLRVLVVDDNLDQADSLGMLLQFQRDIDVRVAYNGSAALQTALDFVPDVMLLDLAMPRVDGFHLAQLVREQKALSETILIALTGYAGDTFEETARTAGFTHYLLKPVDTRQLLALLRGARGQLHKNVEERRELVDDIAAMARRQSERAAEAAKHLRDRKATD